MPSLQNISGSNYLPNPALNNALQSAKSANYPVDNLGKDGLNYTYPDNSLAVIYTKSSSSVPTPITCSAPALPAIASPSAKPELTFMDKFYNKHGYSAEWDAASGRMKLRTCGVSSSYDFKLKSVTEDSIAYELVDSRLSYIASKASVYSSKGLPTSLGNIPKSEIVFKFENPEVLRNLDSSSTPYPKAVSDGLDFMNFIGKIDGKIEWEKENSKFNISLNGSTQPFIIKDYTVSGSKTEFVVAYDFNSIVPGKYDKLVEDAQKYLLALNKAGYKYDLGIYGPNHDGVDGKLEIGGKTYTAIKKFQQECVEIRDNLLIASKRYGLNLLKDYGWLDGISPTGMLDEATFNAMKIRLRNATTKIQTDVDKLEPLELEHSSATNYNRVLDQYIEDKYKDQLTLTLCVQQPVEDSRECVDIMPFSKFVGHTTIRVERWVLNDAGERVKRVRYVGFWPGEKYSLEEAINKETVEGVVKDDYPQCKWDIAKVYIISQEQARKALDFAINYSSTNKFNIVNNNCTTFAANLSTDTGLEIPIQEHKWTIPALALGVGIIGGADPDSYYGYSPADASEDIKNTGTYLKRNYVPAINYDLGIDEYLYGMYVREFKYERN